jgi:hypothetical protein
MSVVWSNTAGGRAPLEPPTVETAGDTDALDIARLAGFLEVDNMLSFSDLVELCEDNGLFDEQDLS